MPISFAFLFIISEKFSTLPATASATVTATSLKDSSIIAYNKSFNLYSSPTLSFIFTLGIVVAFFETLTIWFVSAFSNATIHVIIFVVLAIAIFILAFFSKRIRPESPSINTADFAIMSLSFSVVEIPFDFVNLFKQFDIANIFCLLDAIQHIIVSIIKTVRNLFFIYLFIISFILFPIIKSLYYMFYYYQ